MSARVVGNGHHQTEGAEGGEKVDDGSGKHKIDGPSADQTLAEYLNRTHVVPLVNKCPMDKDCRVSL